MKTHRPTDLFEPEDAEQIRLAFTEGFLGQDKMRPPAILFMYGEEDQQAESGSEQVFICSSSWDRLPKGYVALEQRADLERVRELLEAGGLSVAATKLKDEMLNKLARIEEGIEDLPHESER